MATAIILVSLWTLVWWARADHNAKSGSALESAVTADTCRNPWHMSSGVEFLQRSAASLMMSREPQNPSTPRRVGLLKYFNDTNCTRPEGTARNVSLEPGWCSMGWTFTCACQHGEKAVIARAHRHGCNTSTDYVDYVFTVGSCMHGKATASDADAYALFDDYGTCPCCGEACAQSDGGQMLEQEDQRLDGESPSAPAVMRHFEESIEDVAPEQQLTSDDWPIIKFTPFPDTACQNWIWAWFGLHEYWTSDPAHCMNRFNFTCGCNGDERVILASTHFPSCTDQNYSVHRTWPLDECIWDPLAYEGQNHFIAHAPGCPSCAPQCCTVHGDPHITVFDQAEVSLLSNGIVSKHSRSSKEPNWRAEDSFGWGDFWLVKSKLVLVQARYRKVYYPKALEPLNHTYLTAVAVGGPFIHGHKLVIEPQGGAMVWTSPDGGVHKDLIRSEIGGEELEIDLAGFAKAKYHRRTALVNGENMDAVLGLDIQLPSGVTLLVDRFGKHLDLRLQMPVTAGGEGGVDGQCGNYNGDASDDTAELIEQRIGFQVPDTELLFDKT